MHTLTVGTHHTSRTTDSKLVRDMSLEYNSDASLKTRTFRRRNIWYFHMRNNTTLPYNWR